VVCGQVIEFDEGAAEQVHDVFWRGGIGERSESDDIREEHGGVFVSTGNLFLAALQSLGDGAGEDVEK
jgi:hypothetical protein